MASAAETGEIVKRALGYPYARPERSFLYLDGAAHELAPHGPDLADRTALISYGANAAPEALARKLAPLPGVGMPVLRAELSDFDVVYSAHVSPYGAVVATVIRSPGTAVAIHVVLPDAEQLPILSSREPNYELTELEEVSLRLADVVGANGTPTELSSVGAYVSRHGPLLLDGEPIGLAAIAARGREHRALAEPEVLELVRAAHAPGETLEDFIVRAAAGGGIAPLPPLYTR